MFSGEVEADSRCDDSAEAGEVVRWYEGGWESKNVLEMMKSNP